MMGLVSTANDLIGAWLLHWRGCAHVPAEAENYEILTNIYIFFVKIIVFSGRKQFIKGHFYNDRLPYSIYILLKIF